MYNSIDGGDWSRGLFAPVTFSSPLARTAKMNVDLKTQMFSQEIQGIFIATAQRVNDEVKVINTPLSPHSLHSTLSTKNETRWVISIWVGYLIRPP
ncbi:hypothetical protein ACTXT7_017129 [Hymenolepis weldensis]